MLDNLNRPGRKDFYRRLGILAGFMAAVFIILILRLYYLQVVQGPYFRRLSEENRVSLIRVRAPRGNIYDRYGNLLVTNRPSFTVKLILENVQDLPKTIGMLSEILGLDRQELFLKTRRVEPHRGFDPIRVKEDVSRREVAILETLRYDYPGVQIEVEPRRSYPFGKLAFHVLGYVGQISPKEMRDRAGQGYRIGDYIGKMEIEKELDSELRGQDGVLRMEVDSLGREVKVLASTEPIPGNDVTLTLDLGIQQIADKVLEGKAGAVVVMDSRNGDILAASSSPGVDPNLFSRGISREEWELVERDERHPLQNRFLRAQYPPGSVFKIVTAIAGLETGLIGADTHFFCRGFLKFGGRRYECWKKGGHGDVYLHRALVESCDVFFYQAGMKVGIDAIAHYAREFGLGKPTGLGLGAEASGLVPSTAWKRKVRGEPWFPGETLSAAIGQSYNLVTPLQMAVLAGALANGGTVYRPRLVQAVTDAKGKVVREYPRQKGRRVNVSAESLTLVKDALWGVVNEPRGTGRAARVKGIEVSGKTGTAQVVRLLKDREREKVEDVPERFRDHAWFISYAPSNDSKVAIAILVEHGGHGGSASAPLAKKILAEMKNFGLLQVLASR